MTLTQPPVPDTVVDLEARPASRRRPTPTRRAPLRARITGGAFLAPSVLLVVALLVVPFLFTIYRSFFDDNGFTRRWVGIANYQAMFADPAFGQSVLNTFLWVVGTLLLPVGIGLAIAVGTWKLRLGGLARFAIVLPYAISGSATAVVWTFMLSTDGGLDTLLRMVGLGGLVSQWLLQWPLNTVMMIIATTWQATGACVILFLVGLQSIPPNTLEAAQIDGASGWRLFWSVTFPQLRPMTVVVVGISIVGSLKVFDQVLLLTNGGPGTASETLALTMYRETFTLSRYGSGAAVAVFLTLVVVVASWAYLRRQLRPTD
ncbi:carbohydrate ABC transporter membrane protein 1 (CUT1 family) [Curtobacterium flaccumfaciens]|uniref:Carbohydrate ABC transporter membrane protein 1 (CUT1 family) n=1 Tax=Curtobacterium flaccumfaciens TaxID=2035 RepID=A0A4R6DEL9_9MICO|nr:sugar ABC transporter permease [Curtobacterium flaccumfaciens]TDN42418.1 carbohydrate ABC transporter membrane protein 1 (CUT1 family) [Curtobacterium flaccumfaciens]